MQPSYTLETKTTAGLVNKLIEGGAHFFYIPGQFRTDFGEKFIETLCNFGWISYSRPIELKLINCSFIRLQLTPSTAFWTQGRAFAVFSDWFVLSMRMQVILDSLFLWPGWPPLPPPPIGRAEERVQDRTIPTYGQYVLFTSFSFSKACSSRFI